MSTRASSIYPTKGTDINLQGSIKSNQKDIGYWTGVTRGGTAISSLTPTADIPINNWSLNTLYSQTPFALLTGTNFTRFTATKTGEYYISMSVRYSTENTSAGNVSEIYLQHSVLEDIATTTIVGTGTQGSGTSTVSSNVRLISGDSVTFQAYIGPGFRITPQSITIQAIKYYV